MYGQLLLISFFPLIFPISSISWGPAVSTPGSIQYTSGFALASPGENQYELFVLSINQGLWQRSWYNNAWGDWRLIANDATSKPTAVSWKRGAFAVFYLGTNNNLRVYWSDGGTTRQFTLFSDETFQGAPSVCSWAENRMLLALRTQSGKGKVIWWEGQDPTTWVDWISSVELADDPTTVSSGKGLVSILFPQSIGFYHIVWTPWKTSSKLAYGVSYSDLGGKAVLGSRGSGFLDLWIRTTDNLLKVKTYLSGPNFAWSDFERVPIECKFEPAFVTSLSNVRNVRMVVVGTDGVQKHYDLNSEITPFQRVDLQEYSIILHSIGASSRAGGLDVFLGTNQENGNVFYRRYFNQVWGNWQQLGDQPIRGKPASVAWSDTRIDVFAMYGILLVHIWWDGSSWSAWETIPTLTSNFYPIYDPAVCSWGNRRLDVFVVGDDGALWHKAFDNTMWWNWEKLGGQLTSAPAAVSWGNGRIDVFARSSKGYLMQKYYANGWSDWMEFPDCVMPNDASPSVASWAARRLDIVWRGVNSNMMQKTWNGEMWLPVLTIPIYLISNSNPTIAADKVGRNNYLAIYDHYDSKFLYAYTKDRSLSALEQSELGEMKEAESKGDVTKYTFVGVLVGVAVFALLGLMVALYLYKSKHSAQESEEINDYHLTQ